MPLGRASTFFKRRAQRAFHQAEPIAIGNKLVVGIDQADQRSELYTFARIVGERAELAPMGHRLANALYGLGIGAGDRVSFITYNTHHLLEAYYGVLEAGAVLNPINIRLTPHEIAYILEHAGSKLVAFHRDFLPLVEAKFLMRNS